MAVRIESHAEPIPGYKLIERIGGGGFGEVWKVEAPGGLLKAIKFVFGDLETSSEDGHRAEQELKALSRVKTVRHPYILSLERFDIIEGRLLIVMELADRNLWDRFRECRGQGLIGIPRQELLRYMEESAEALDLMNTDYQLQHLDIKPQNIFLVHNHAKVADFGLVKDLQGMMASVTGGVTPVYAAPETFDGWISRFSDQYSLAIVYQELLTGQRPFVGANVRQLIMQHIQGTPNLESLPQGDREIVGRALAKNPDDRYPSCIQFVHALRKAGQEASHVEDRGDSDSWLDSRAIWPAGSSPGPSLRPQSTPGLVKVEANALTPAESSEPADDTHWLRVHGGGESFGPDTPDSKPKLAEVKGTGLLFPGLVIGLGQVGLGIIRKLREKIVTQLGAANALPNCRLIYLDTDPDAPKVAARSGSGVPLSPGEVVMAKLNRPGYYVRTYGGKDCMDSWFDPKMLYRIPRNLLTKGLRPLGRLAFFDNYRSISRRLQSELDECSEPETLRKTAEKTALGQRTNRPRVYIVTSLAGGTGSGMFIDVAYVMRHLVKQRGFEQPDIVGIFVLPPADRNPSRTVPLGNAYAALTELNHFSSPATTYLARFEDRGKPIVDQAPPFNRCIVLPLSDGDEAATLEINSLAGEFLFREMTSNLGRTADDVRASFPAPSRRPGSMTCQTFGMYRISWPRHTLLRNVARKMCARLVQGWMSRDATGVRKLVQNKVESTWTQLGFDGESLLRQLQGSCETILGKSTDSALAALTAPLQSLPTHDQAELSVGFCKVIDGIESTLGRPDSTTGGRFGVLAQPLSDTAKLLENEWGSDLARIAFSLAEKPDFRLAGAEEAVRQMIASVEKILVHYEPLGKEFANRSLDAHTRMWELLGTVQNTAANDRRLLPAVNNLVELLHIYPKWRLQSLLLQKLSSVYVSLRGYLSDQLREINFCRARLGDLQFNFEDPAKLSVHEEPEGVGRSLYPDGCRTMEEAVELILSGISSEDVGRLDEAIQALIEQQFTALVHVCMTPSNLIENLESAMQTRTEAVLGTRLTGIGISEMLMADHRPEEIEDQLAEAFCHAVPAMKGARAGKGNEICVLGTPPGPEGEQLRDYSMNAISEVEIHASNTAGDIVFYRELPNLPLSDLEQLGPLAHEAYCQMVSVEHFTPHSRTDILEWRAATAG